MEKLPGLTEWFLFGDTEHVRKTVAVLKDLRSTEFRCLFSWADFEREGGREWQDFVVASLKEVPQLKLLPTLFYTPPEKARKDSEGNTRTSHPPEDLETYTLFVEEIISRYGDSFDYIQLWNEPNWDPYWSWALDPWGDVFADMVVPAAKRAQELQKKTVLGGTSPLEYAWFMKMHERGVLEHIDVVCVHYALGWTNTHRRWFPLPIEINALKSLLLGMGQPCEIWLDESGLSTCTEEDQNEEEREKKQIEFFDLIRGTPADRVYWFSVFDQKPDTPTDDELNTARGRDPTAYHFGLVTVDGRKKALYEHWKSLTEEKKES